MKPMRTIAFIPVVILAGCSLAPTYEQPSTPVATSYPQHASEKNTAGTPVAGLGWRTYFRDPQLLALIELGLERNRDLAQSLAQIEQARARLRIQDSQRLPNIDLGGTGARSRTPASSLANSGATGGVQGAGSHIEAEQYAANVSVGVFELDLWGRLRSLSEAERLRYLATVEGARDARLTLIAEIASTYFDVRAGVERTMLAEQSLIGRREGVAIAKDRLDAGVTSTVDYDQTVQLLTQAENELAVVRRTTAQSKHLLDVLVGGPSESTLPSAIAFQEPQTGAIKPGLPSDLLHSRPDLLEAEFNLKAANANIGALRAQFFPTISLTGAYGYAAPALSGLVQDDNLSWSFGGAIDLPIFDWGRRRAELREGKARADELVAAYQRTAQGAFQEVADALVGRQYYHEQLIALGTTVQTQERLVETARLRYENGVSIYLEVLDAERNLFASQQELLQLRATALQNDIALYVALGGGTMDKTEPLKSTLD